MAYSGPQKVKVRGSASSPDPDETAALQHACDVTGVSKTIATNVISAWIAKRAELSAGARLTENLAFDLSDAKLRGFAAASLSHIGGALTIPADVPFFDLEREQVVDVLCIGFQAIREAAVAAGESPDFILDSEVPF